MADTVKPTENPEQAGTAPVDLTTLGDAAPPPAGNAATPQTGADAPLGGEALTEATSWTGAPDEELDDA